MIETLKDPKVIFSGLILFIGAACVFLFPNSQPHMILGTNAISAVAGYWIGTSISSSNKDKAILGGINNESKVKVDNSSNPVISG